MTSIAIGSAVFDVPRSAEEALLDVYDLQWKTIDIRLEQLRNECERMILEYEVELKQQMYLRECEELLHQQADEASSVRQELKETERLLQESQQEVEILRKKELQEPRSNEVIDKEDTFTTRRKNETSKPKVKKKVDVQNMEGSNVTVRRKTRQESQRKTNGANIELLEMLEEDKEEEDASEPMQSLIIDSPAMLTPKRSQQVQKPETPIEIEMEPESSTDESEDVDPMIALFTPKRALKRRKMSPHPSPLVTVPVETKTAEPTNAASVVGRKKAQKIKEKAPARANKDKQKKKKKVLDEKVVGDTVDDEAKKMENKLAAAMAVKQAALRAMDGEQEVGIFASIKDISTPKDPLKVKKKKSSKQTRHLAAKRAEFQALLSETREETVSEEGNRKKRARSSTQSVSELSTPLKKKKRTNESAASPFARIFANDELNIMKSPMPREASTDQEQEKSTTKKSKKRTVLDRDGHASEDYQSPAQPVMAPLRQFSSSVLPLGVSTTISSTYRPVELAKKTTSKMPSIRSGGSFFDAFVNNAKSSIPRLKAISMQPRIR